MNKKKKNVPSFEFIKPERPKSSRSSGKSEKTHKARKRS